MMKHYLKRRKQEFYACLFGMFLLTGFVVSISAAFLSAGPIVLGTELNTNGSVEYLCLGMACENFQAMDW